MKERIGYLQWLRMFAAAAVVMMHTAAYQWYSVPVDSNQWQALNFYDSLVRWPVPVFVMITGAVFLPRETSLRDILKKYIPRLMISYLFWCGVYTFAAWRGGMEISQLPLKFLQGHYHLWYIPFLWGVYLVIPFLQRIVREERLTDQLLAVSFLFGAVVPWMADLALLVCPEWSSHIKTVENDLDFSFFRDNLFFLVLGYWLSSRDLTKVQRRLIYAAGLLGLAVTAGATRWASIRAGVHSSLFYDVLAPNNVCAAAALFVFAKYHLSSLPRVVDSLAKASFGIYLMHPLVIELLAGRGIHTLAWDPWVSVPVLSAAVIGVCWLASRLISKIPLIGKYLV